MQRSRLRRINSSSMTNDAVMGDLAALFWLRDEEQALSHYAIDDCQRVLLEDVSWFEDAHQTQPAQGADNASSKAKLQPG